MKKGSCSKATKVSNQFAPRLSMKVLKVRRGCLLIIIKSVEISDWGGKDFFFFFLSQNFANIFSSLTNFSLLYRKNTLGLLYLTIVFMFSQFRLSCFVYCCLPLLCCVLSFLLFFCLDFCSFVTSSMFWFPSNILLGPVWAKLRGYDVI